MKLMKILRDHSQSGELVLVPTDSREEAMLREIASLGGVYSAEFEESIPGHAGAPCIIIGFTEKRPSEKTAAKK